MMKTQTMVSYYKESQFNPVPIALDTPLAWETHVAKRRNLYERHLGIPLALLAGHSILEFGSNSGENALVLASFGANLTLVEPNEQVLARLHGLFNQFNLAERVAKLVQTGIESFETEDRYSLVLAEGFLYTLPNRNEMVQKIGHLLRPGGLAVIAFIDRFGSLIELTRRLILWRVYQLASISEVDGSTALELAKRLYAHDFAQLKASRPFEAWWQDNLVSPFLVDAHLWSYQELLPVIEQAGGELHAVSPQWASMDHFTWYKVVSSPRQRHQHFLAEWAKFLPFFLTGLVSETPYKETASAEVVEAIIDLIHQISTYTLDLAATPDAVVYPALLDQYLQQNANRVLRTFNQEMKQVYESISSNQLERIISTYHQTQYLRNLWGSPYHYLCFSKQLDPKDYYPSSSK